MLCGDDSGCRECEALEEACQTGTYEWQVAEDRLHWSPGLLKIYGLERAPTAEEGFTRLIHPDDRIRVEAETSTYMGSGAESYSHRFRIVRPDGVVREILDRGVIERDVSGIVRVIRGRNVDLTDLLLQPSPSGQPSRAGGPPGRESLHLEGAGYGVSTWEVGTSRAWWSRGCFELFGFSTEAGVPRFDEWLRQRVHAHDRERVERELTGFFEAEAGCPCFCEYRIDHPQRGTRWILARGTIEPGNAGRARQVMVNIDVTDLKSAQIALAESESRLRTALRAGRLGVHEFDPRSNMIRWDSTVREIWGVPADEPITFETFARGLHPADLHATKLAVDAALDPDGPGRYEAVFRVIHRGTGRIRWVRADGDVAFADGTPVRLVGTAKDITERKNAEAARADSESRLRIATAAAELGVFEWLVEEDRAIWENDRMFEIFGHAREDGSLSRKAFVADYLEPADRASFERALGDAMRPGASLRVACRIRRKADRDLRWIEFCGSFDFARNGAPERLVGVVADITERRRATEALRAAHDAFRSLVERSPFGIYAVDADFRLVQVSDGAQKVFASVRPLLGRDFAEVLRILWPEPFASDAIARFRHTLATGEPYHAPSTVERRADIDATEAYDWRIERIVLPDGRPGVVCHFYDLSERQRHEEHIRLLMREVSHRSKNMLALIQAIARQTAATGEDDAFARFDERIQSLAAAQDLLVSNDWKAVPLADLVRSQLSHFVDLIDRRIAIEGPPLHLTPAATQALGMALHELATNAAKYGALSTDTGRVSIAWSLRTEGGAPRFAISWTERDGPTVAMPRRRGFGTTVLVTLAEASVGGDAVVDYPPGGLTWRLACPLDRVIEARSPQAPAEPHPARPAEPRPAAGSRRVLVVEDEAVIAIEMAAVLAGAGFEVVGPAAGVGEALALLDREGCDAAVLDVNLGKETSEPIARELIARGKAFVVVSGYARDQLPELLRAAPLLGKPVRAPLLEREVRHCLGDGAARP